MINSFSAKLHQVIKNQRKSDTPDAGCQLPVITNQPFRLTGTPYKLLSWTTAHKIINIYMVIKYLNNVIMTLVLEFSFNPSHWQERGAAVNFAILSGPNLFSVWHYQSHRNSASACNTCFQHIEEKLQIWKWEQLILINQYSWTCWTLST